jgi:hypothetical protein
VGLTGSGGGALLGPLFGAFGYRKQFWKTALRRKHRLSPVPHPARPVGTPLIGIAQPFERTLAGPGSQPAPLVVAISIRSSRGIFVRSIDAVPFWLVLEDRKVLVTGRCWPHTDSPELGRPVNETLRQLGAEKLPLSRRERRLSITARTTISAGDRIAVIGALRQEQVAGVGGYRDSLTDVIRGEPGESVWLEPAPAR